MSYIQSTFGLPRVGYYCWAGPGTVRMLNLKYFNPAMNVGSIMGSYETPYLQAIQNTFGVTDVWAAYSWGFADEREAEDRAFLLSRLDNFHGLGLRVHAYVQGLNLVYKDFVHTDWFCRDEKNRLIPYHRGRKQVCPNNPGFRAYIMDKLRTLAKTEVDGIFLDNIFFGQMGLPWTKRCAPAFVGCACAHCQQLFGTETGAKIPTRLVYGEIITQAYLDFRMRSVASFMAEAAAIARSAGKEFGSNSLDPAIGSRFVYGNDLTTLDATQNYLLFERLGLSDHLSQSNAIITDLYKKQIITKPTFVVNYRRGIGFDGVFSQSDINRVYSEAQTFGYYPCLKGSEFCTKGEWHNLDVSVYQKPRAINIKHLPTSRVWKRERKISGITGILVGQFLNPLLALYWENRLVRKIFGFIERKILIG